MRSHLKYFSSPTLQGRQLIAYNKVKIVIEKSKKAIFAGAFITQKTIDFVESFHSLCLLIRNGRITVRKHAIEKDPRMFNVALIKYLQGGGKPYVYWDSKKQAETFIAELRGASMEDPFLMEKYENMIFYNSDSDDILFQGLENINQVWDNASFVMATPSITVGNSYSPTQTTFTSVWIYSFPTCIVADTFQGHKRVRHTTTGKLYFAIPDSSVLRYVSNLRGDIISTLAGFDDLTTEKRRAVVAHANKRIEKYLKQGETNEQYNAIVRALGEEYEITPEPLRRLLFQNVLENDLSVKCFEKMFIHFLDVCGYDIVKEVRNEQGEFITTQIDEDARAKLTLQEIRNLVNYEDIRIISIDELEIVKKKIHKKMASKPEKNEVQRYYFDCYIDNTLTDSIKNVYFKSFIDTHEKAVLTNLYNEANNRSDYRFLAHFESKKSSAENIKFESMKLTYIRQIMKRLGLANSLDMKEIKRETIEAIGGYLLENRTEINKVFHFRDQTKNPEATVIQSIQILEKIIRSWCGGVIRGGGDKKNKKSQTAYLIVSHYQEFPPYAFRINNDNEYIDIPQGLSPALLESITITQTEDKQTLEMEQKNVIEDLFDDKNKMYRMEQEILMQDEAKQKIYEEFHQQKVQIATHSNRTDFKAFMISQKVAVIQKPDRDTDTEADKDSMPLAVASQLHLLNVISHKFIEPQSKKYWKQISGIQCEAMSKKSKNVWSKTMPPPNTAIPAFGPIIKRKKV